MKLNNHEEQDVKEIVLKVLSEKDGWSKHIDHTCGKCQNCNCGKHKCKLVPFKLGMTPAQSTYNQSFHNRKQLDSSNVKLKGCRQEYHPKQLVNYSEYRGQFNQKKEGNEQAVKGKARPNNLQIGGPTFSSTVYQESFNPKNSPPAQKIKNIDNLTNCRMKMKTTSNYMETYQWNAQKPVAKEKPIKQRDNLKTEQSPFVAKSSYAQDYNPFTKSKKMNRDNFAPERKYRSTQGMRAKTSYQAEYTEKRPDLCPATFC